MRGSRATNGTGASASTDPSPAARLGFGPDFELGLEGERRESRAERAGHGLMLRGRMRW